MEEAEREATILAAEGQGIPAEPLGALFYAESGMNPLAERWYTQTKAAKAAIAAEDWDALQAIINLIADSGSDDISFGLDQRTWRWSDEFAQAQAETGKSLDELRRDMDLILAFRHDGFEAQYAADRGAAMFAPLYRQYGVPEALYRYNKPNGTATKSVKQHYDQALVWSAQQNWTDEEEDAMTEFAFETDGFYNKAQELGDDIVGQPIEAEHPVGNNYVVQFTTTGVMVYVRSLNQNYFFAAAR
jgi:hypothetical protein